MRQVSTFFLAFVALVAQSQKVPHGDEGFAFEDFAPGYADYPDRFEQMKDVDFKNLAAHFAFRNERSSPVARLRNGRYEGRANSCYQDVTLDESHLLPSLVSDHQYSLALYTWLETCGSSSQTGIAQVFELRERRLRVVQQLDWDEHFDTSQPYVSYDENSKTLVVRAAHYRSGDAHCCVSAMDVITLRWNGTKLVRKSMQTELSGYGLRKGKKISR